MPLLFLLEGGAHWPCFELSKTTTEGKGRSKKGGNACYQKVAGGSLEAWVTGVITLAVRETPYLFSLNGLHNKLLSVILSFKLVSLTFPRVTIRVGA
jgi:hypothetical protein